MALREIEPYILDPESEPEFEVEQHHGGQRFHHNVTGTDCSSWDQNGCKIFPQPRKKSSHPHLSGSIQVTLESEPMEDHMSESETHALSDEGDFSEEEEGGGKGNGSSDEDWVPQTLIEEGNEDVEKTSSEEDSDEDDFPENEKTSRGQKVKQLCTDCGSFHYSENHVCEHKTKPFVCNVCGKRCVTEYSLKAHCNIHSETYEHYCKYCYGTFKTKTDKLNHEQTHQNESQPYKCPDCEMTFASLKGRRKHMKLHKGPDEFKCDFCGLTIGKKHKLRHMMIHTGAKPYKCSICERTFNQAGNLKSHMRLHTGERPYKCQHCDKAFNHNVSLKSHVQRYHSLESGYLLDKIYEGLTDMQDGTAGDSGDSTVVKQETEQMQKPKDIKYCTGRPRGRPKRNTTTTMKHPRSKSSEENVDNSYDSNDESQGFTDYYNDLIDFHQEEILKAERNIKRKHKSRSNSDSDYDPNDEIVGSKKRGRPRKV